VKRPGSPPTDEKPGYQITFIMSERDAQTRLRNLRIPFEGQVEVCRGSMFVAGERAQYLLTIGAGAAVSNL
jgi:hypothetical protein